MKTKKFWHVLFPLFLISGMMSSCFEDVLDLNKLSKDISIGTSLVVPIGETSISVEDLLSKLTDENTDLPIKTDGGVITVFFKDSIDINELEGLDVEQYKDNSHHYNLSNYMTLPAIVPDGIPVIYTIDQTYTFSENDIPSQQHIDSLQIKGSKVTINVSSNVNIPAHFLNIKMPFPEEFKGLDHNFIDIDLLGTLTTKQYQVPDFTLNLSQKSELSLPVILTINGDGVTYIPEDAFIDIQVIIDEIKFTAYGLFNFNLTNDILTGDFNLGVFDKIPEGCKIHLANPTIKFDITSNIGFPINFNVNHLRVYETENTSIERYARFDGSNYMTFKIEKADAPGETKTSSLTLNKDYGETNRLFEIKADNIDYDLSVGIAPPLSPTEVHFFNNTDSKLKAKFSVEVPIWLSKESILTYSDTIKNIDGSLSELGEIEYIEEAMLKLRVTNRLPFKTTFQVELLDNDMNVINPTRKYKYTIGAANVNSEGEAISERESEIRIEYNTETIADLKQTKHLKFSVSLEGYDANAQMKLKTDDWIRVKVSAYVKAGVKTSFDSNQQP